MSLEGAEKVNFDIGVNRILGGSTLNHRIIYEIEEISLDNEL